MGVPVTLLPYEILSPYAEFLLPASYVGFFVFTLIIYRYRHSSIARRGYLAVFFSALIVTNLTALTPFPFTDMHKFGDSGPSESTYYKIYVEDTSGEELRFDRRILPTVAPGPFDVEWGLGEVCSPKQTKQVGRYLLWEARSYRASVEHGGYSFLDWFDFPRHHLGFRWTANRLEGYERFVQLNIYRVHVQFAPGSSEVRSKTRERVRTVRLSPNERFPIDRLESMRTCS